MRCISIFTSFLIFCASCNLGYRKNEGLFAFKDTTIHLKDSLVDVNIVIPNRYDTFLKWTQYSDCGGCGTERYRFQSKSSPIFLESGFFWHDLKDSVDQLTIIHRQRALYNDSMSNDYMKSLHSKLVEDAKIEPLFYKSNHVFDTLQLVNGKWASLIISEKYDSLTREYAKAVWGAMLLRGKLVQLQFSLLTKTKDSINETFIPRSKQLMMKIFSNNGM